MIRDELIFDRTQADIDTALTAIRLNIPLPADNLKVSWDWRALNRIEAFTEQLAKLLTSYGYTVRIITKTDWDTESLNSELEGNRILENLIKIRTAFGTLHLSPSTPTSPSYLTFTQANDIERILFDTDQLIELMSQSFMYSGEIYSGEV